MRGVGFMIDWVCFLLRCRGGTGGRCLCRRRLCRFCIPWIGFVFAQLFLVEAEMPRPALLVRDDSELTVEGVDWVCFFSWRSVCLAGAHRWEVVGDEVILPVLILQRRTSGIGFVLYPVAAGAQVVTARRKRACSARSLCRIGFVLHI
jgi:hypothetical protein